MMLDCGQFIESLYDDFDDSGSAERTIFSRLWRQAHLFFCPDCAREERKLKIAAKILENDFFPSAPDLSDSIMAMVRAEALPALEAEKRTVPLFGWVVAGFFLLLSLISAYFSGNFLDLDTLKGSSYMLPVGIIIGMVVIGYGAIFIGTHLDQLCKKFGVGIQD
jgi:hypothetical protein